MSTKLPLFIALFLVMCGGIVLLLFMQNRLHIQQQEQTISDLKKQLYDEGVNLKSATLDAYTCQNDLAVTNLTPTLTGQKYNPLIFGLVSPLLEEKQFTKEEIFFKDHVIASYHIPEIVVDDKPYALSIKTYKHAPFIQIASNIQIPAEFNDNRNLNFWRVNTKSPDFSKSPKFRSINGLTFYKKPDPVYRGHSRYQIMIHNQVKKEYHLIDIWIPAGINDSTPQQAEKDMRSIMNSMSLNSDTVQFE